MLTFGIDDFRGGHNIYLRIAIGPMNFRDFISKKCQQNIYERIGRME